VRLHAGVDLRQAKTEAATWAVPGAATGKGVRGVAHLAKIAPISRTSHTFHTSHVKPRTRIVHAQVQLPAHTQRLHGDLAPCDLGLQAVLDAVFNQGLQQQRGHRDGCQFCGQVQAVVQTWPHAHLHQLQVVFQPGELVRQTVLGRA
jgi:hypothetical protein